MSKIDEGEIRKRLDRIASLFTDIVVTADKSSQTRCPYRDRLDRCTGKFRCRNQLSRAEWATPGRDETDNPELSEDDEFPYVCTHDGRFDYRMAWESHPRSYEKAKDKIRSIREDSRRRRLEGDESEQ